MKIRNKKTGEIKEISNEELGNYGLVPEAKSGIKIKPSKKGTFKAQATKMGMGVQEAASKILNAPEGKYSPEMRKKANFAKNFAKQDGGEIEYDEEELYYPYMEEEYMKSGGMIKRADGSYSKRGLWDNIRDNKGSGKKPTKAMLKQEKKIRAAEKAYGGYMENGGGIDNPGFNALPYYVQQNIIDNMAMGGYLPKAKYGFTPRDEGYDPLTNNKYFNRAFKYLDQSKNFAANAINNLATGEKNYDSVLKYNGNIPVTNYNKNIKIKNKVVGSDYSRPELETLPRLKTPKLIGDFKYDINQINPMGKKQYGGNIPKAEGGIRLPGVKRKNLYEDKFNEQQLNTGLGYNLYPFKYKQAPEIKMPDMSLPFSQNTSQATNQNGVPTQFSNYYSNLNMNDAGKTIADQATGDFKNGLNDNFAYNTLNFIGSGVNDALAGINFGKGMLDMIGNDRQNKMEQQRNAEQFTQSVFNSEEFSTPYESRGYGFQGRNSLAENGMQIRDIGGYGQPNVIHAPELNGYFRKKVRR